MLILAQDPSDTAPGTGFLEEFLQRVPNLKVAVTFGKKATEAWHGLVRGTPRGQPIRTFDLPHPSYGHWSKAKDGELGIDKVRRELAEAKVLIDGP